MNLLKKAASNEKYFANCKISHQHLNCISKLSHCLRNTSNLNSSHLIKPSFQIKVLSSLKYPSSHYYIQKYRTKLFIPPHSYKQNLTNRLHKINPVIIILSCMVHRYKRDYRNQKRKGEVYVPGQAQTRIHYRRFSWSSLSFTFSQKAYFF